MAAVSFDGVYDDGHYFPALVVKPCPLLETPQVSSALGRIADRALQIYAHYRFYCYTDGAVGSDPNYGGTPWRVPASMPDWDPDTLTWRDWTDPDDVHWLSRSTIPGVCSSFRVAGDSGRQRAVPADRARLGGGRRQRAR